MAEIPKRATSVENFLLGSTWSEEIISSAMALFDKDFNPISDLRATSEYRKITAKNLLKKYYIETNSVEKNTNVLKIIS
jgi:xanthine dehydrogenase small subunit